MEEPDYYHKLHPNLLSQSSHDIMNQITIQNLYLTYLHNQSNKNQKPKRIIPQVPEFKEEASYVKKVKVLQIQDLEINMISKANELKKTQINRHQIDLRNLEHHQADNQITPLTQIFPPKQQIQQHLLLNQSQKTPLISVLPIKSTRIRIDVEIPDHIASKYENQHFLLRQSFKKIMEPVKQESLTPDEVFAKQSASSSDGKLDKKDSKKLEKFIELFQYYSKKLELASNALIEEKYIELASMAIPKLITNFKSKPFEAIAAAILLFACRETNHPITIKQIANISESKDKIINKCIFSLKEIIPANSDLRRFGSIEFIQLICEKLKLNDNVKMASVQIHNNITALNFIKSIHASTLAACCVKFSSSLSENDKSFDEIAETIGITKMTLKNMYRELFPYRFYFIKENCKLSKDANDLKNI